ncbi:WYL domain-containing protein [Lachnospiraceae bacterium 29-84]
MIRQTEKEQTDRAIRVLEMYYKFNKGHRIDKAWEAQNYGVSERTIRRDIEDIKAVLASNRARFGVKEEIEYDRKEKKYYLETHHNEWLTGGEILAVCKILLDSRAFTRQTMRSILERFLQCCGMEQEQYKAVEELIRKEELYYIELQHQKDVINDMWAIGQAIQKKSYIEIAYQRGMDQKLVYRKLKPVAILFSEFYFYLTAFLDDKDDSRQHFEVMDDAFPTIYRLDRIQNVKLLKEKFYIPYSKEFNEAEFRKRVPFMYGGKLQKVTFRYNGNNIEAVLDRLPTAEIIKEEDGVFTIRAEVFGRKGIELWMRGQGDSIQEAP